MSAYNFVSEKAKKLGTPGICEWHLGIEGPEDLIDLSVGEPDYDVPNEAIEKLYWAAKNGKNKYPDCKGLEELRNKLSIKYSIKESDNLDITITSGASAGIYATVGICFNPGDEVLLTDPFYIQYNEILKINNIKAVFVDTYPDFAFTIDRIKQHMTKNTRGIILNTPNNPTGIVYSDDQIKEIVNFAKENNILVIIDEIYSDFIFSEMPKSNPLNFGDNIVLISGFSKSHCMTGWRLGYVIARKDLIYYMSELQAQIYQGVTTVVQHAGLAAMGCNINKMYEDYKLRHYFVKDNLNKEYSISKSEGGFFFFIKVPERLNMSATEFCKNLKKQGVLFVPGIVFSHKDTHFRMSICKDIENLKRAIDLLNSFVLENKEK